MEFHHPHNFCYGNVHNQQHVFTERRQLSWWQFCRQWWHRMLSSWQLPLPPAARNVLSLLQSPHNTETRGLSPMVAPTIGDNPLVSMMTSPNGNIFRVTGPLCGEFTGPGEFPAQRPVTRSFDVFFDLRLNKRLSKQSRGWWFETLSRSLWRHRDECYAIVACVPSVCFGCYPAMIIAISRVYFYIVTLDYLLLVPSNSMQPLPCH